MAGREKKPALNKKQTPSPVPPKEGAAPPENASVEGKEASTNVVAASKRKPVAKKPIRKKLTAFKSAKNKGSLKLSKSIFNVAKTSLDAKKAALIKNGISAPKRIRRLKGQPVAQKPTIKIEPNDEPPVLEPMEPLPSENGTASEKKDAKKRVGKKGASSNPPDIQDENKPTLELEGTINDTLNFVVGTSNEVLAASGAVGDSVAKKIVAKKGKAAITKKIKEEIETLDDVMNDLSEHINMDTECLKGKKVVTRKAKIESPKRKPTKKENEIALNKDLSNDPSIANVIDMLDLNVSKTPKKKVIKKRRHSIEKFALDTGKSAGADGSDSSLTAFALFPNVPRSVSPRSKRGSKMRQSIDTLSTKRSSPYTTRSDSPARILRNGKQRKLKDSLLLDGIDTDRKRRRLCSDLSGSELSISRNSGFESDTSSYSDLASVQENSGDISDVVQKEPPEPVAKPEVVKMESIIRKEFLEVLSQQHAVEVAKQSLNIKSISTKFTDILKRSLSTDTATNGTGDTAEKSKLDSNNMTDTNSNLCTDVKTEDMTNMTPDIPIKAETTDFADSPNENITLCPNSKVPEKNLILDIMKQTFNDTDEQEKEKERRTTRSSARKKTVVDKSEKTDEKPNLTMSALKFYGAPEETCSDKESLQLQLTNSDTETVNNENDETTVVPETPDETDVVKTTETVEEEQQEDDETKLNEEFPELQLSAEENVEEIDSKSEIQTDKLEKELEIEIPEFIEPSESKPSEVMEDMEENIVENVDVADEPKLFSDDEKSEAMAVEESPENLARKENILQALGLQSLKAAAEAKLREKVVPKQDNYTGTLKTVIKINRMEKKKGKNSLKMTFHKNKGKSKDGSTTEFPRLEDEANYKIMKEAGVGPWRHHGTQSSDTADGSSEHTSDGDTAAGEGGEGATKALVIPEKASSFSIHPGRLCKDECCYCFGKFGLFDTPCHIAQMKSVERQDKILAAETHLTRDSCLCDACYRHVDRKSNTSSYNKAFKKANMVAPGPRINHCHVLGCDQVSVNILKRKWLIKMRKSVSQVINIDLDNPGLHSIPVCENHYASLEHLMVCAMCKRRLARNHIHYLGPECATLNKALDAEGIPVTLVDKPVVCKLCRLFSSILLKPEENNDNKIHFFNEYKRRLLHFHNIELMNDAEAEEPIAFPSKERAEKEVTKKRKTKLSKSQTGPPILELQVDYNKPDQDRVPFDTNNDQSRSESPSDYMVDYATLTPNITMECGSDLELTKREVPRKHQQFLKKNTRINPSMKQSKSLKSYNKSKGNAVERLGSNPSISVRQLFPGEEDLPLQGGLEFNVVKERTPEGWEKCNCTIQYDLNTKHLWQDLQKPYGNQSSFLRHLILLEKYFRNGDLVLSQNASHHAINYSESVQNRLRAYDNISTSTPHQPISLLPLNQAQSPVKKSCSGIVTTNKEISSPFTMINAANIPKNTPITLSQINSLTPVSIKPKPPSVPPGLISIQPGSNKQVAPVVKMQQKIKFPVGKNWKPTLIPVNQSTISSDKKRISGLVQVISGGKPYHISLEDYNRMCSIKRSNERKQAENKLSQHNSAAMPIQNNSLLKSNLLTKKKLSVTSKTLANLNIKPLPDDCGPSDNINEPKVEPNTSEKSLIVLPKIPKSLTVIPQTVSRRTSRPSSPVVSITSKSKTSSTVGKS